MPIRTRTARMPQVRKKALMADSLKLVHFLTLISPPEPSRRGIYKINPARANSLEVLVILDLGRGPDAEKALAHDDILARGPGFPGDEPGDLRTGLAVRGLEKRP